MPYSVTLANIFIPRENIVPFVVRLASHLPADEQGRRAIDVLLVLLTRDSWVASLLADGRIHIVGRDLPLATIVDNPVLTACVGYVEAGSFVQGYGEQNLQWQLRFYETRSLLAYGDVTFPAEPEWNALSRSLLFIREATAEDSIALQAMGSQEGPLAPGSVLLAERAGEIVAYVRHNPHPEDATLEVITRLVMRPNGRHNGYPQALIAHLQRQYPRLLALSVKPDHRRIWREMGFVLQEPAIGEKQTRLTQQYVWTAPQRDHEQ